MCRPRPFRPCRPSKSPPDGTFRVAKTKVAIPNARHHSCRSINDRREPTVSWAHWYTSERDGLGNYWCLQKVLHIACSVINTIINILHMPNGVDIHSVFRYRHHYMDDSPRRLPIMAKYEYLQKKAGRKKPAVYAEGLAYPALP